VDKKRKRERKESNERESKGLFQRVVEENWHVYGGVNSRRWGYAQYFKAFKLWGMAAILVVIGALSEL
jgi:hypothetical protein